MTEGLSNNKINLDMKEENKNKNFGYYLGQALAFVLVGCLAAISIAVTYKIIMWVLYI